MFPNPNVQIVPIAYAEPNLFDPHALPPPNYKTYFDPIGAPSYTSPEATPVVAVSKTPVFTFQPNDDPFFTDTEAAAEIPEDCRLSSDLDDGNSG